MDPFANVPSSVGAAEVRALQGALQGFLEATSAHWVALCDRAGNLLFHEGKDPGSDVAILCALAAGSFAASRELARRLGTNEFAEQVHEGEGLRILLHSLDTETLLVVVFQHSTSIGLVRYYAAKLANEVTGMVEEIARAGAIAFGQLPPIELDPARPLLS
ncbi:MAG TPA: roadblock/LC7 domain-containing protein [Verrucomicrobiae bacterium]|nr:roadblock/LC7 domain-containing protein [Verrucomicrobiae bacterium]